MSYSLFLDDERMPPAHGADWIVVRTCEEAKAIVRSRGMPAFISFGHDLGGDERAMDFVHWLGEYVLDERPSLDDFDFYVHSQNPVGAANIEGFMRNLVRVCRE